jgi:flagellar basal-body rod protein FlgF
MQGASLILTAYQDALSKAMDVVANNVANINTTGFKREELKFDTLLSQPTTQDKYQFAIDKGTFRDTEQGPSLKTGSPLDLAIQGAGYFQVQTSAGTRYTRSGAFQLNSQNQIITANGDKLLGDGDSPIIIPEDANEVVISADGVVSTRTGNSNNSTEIGKLKLVKFQKEQAMQMVGNNLYNTSETPQTDTDSGVVQGMLEQSNVQSVTEITNMIEINRTYATAVHLLDTESQRMKDAITRLSKASA